MRPTLLFLTLALGLAACAPARSTTQTSTAPAQAPVTPTAPAQPTTPAPAASGYTTLPYLADKPAASYPQAQQVLDPTKKYRALLNTSKGLVTIDLNATVAPIAVNSFVFLALNHFYDGLKFHRVVAGFVAQGGDPTGTGAGGPGYTFTTETSPQARFDSAGVLGMARAQSRDSNGSQFFITLAPADFLTENGSAPADTITSVQIQAATK